MRKLPPNPVEGKECCNHSVKPGPIDITVIYNRYHREIFQNAFRILRSASLSEDIVQEVFIKLCLKSGHLHEVEDLKAYLFIITRNVAFTFLKKQNTYRDLLQEFENYQGGHTGTEEPYGEQFYQSITEAIEKLSPQQKLVYRLKREHNWKREKIAKELNISPCTVKATMQHALRSIKNHVMKKMVA